MSTYIDTSTESLFDYEIGSAEKELLDLADYIYIHSNIKPYSRVIYILSRLIALGEELKDTISAQDALTILRKKYSDILEEQDYNAEYLFNLIGNDFDRIKKVALKILSLAPLGTDTLGFIFNTLLRGKFEAGEGLGTFLTPEEIVNAMVEISIKYYYENGNDNRKLVFADVTGGTGRFGFEFNNACKKLKIESQIILADQSKFSLDLAKINFMISEKKNNVVIIPVKDSITDKMVNSFNNKIDIICTNPPFGNNKYENSEDIRILYDNTIVNALGLNNKNSKTDPALMFFIKNIQLLKEDGILSIVLPDGVIYGKQFSEIIKSNMGDNITIKAIISLPAVAFSLGGTVAKTSFIILKRSKNKNSYIYYAQANHIGFLKKGNKRIVDKNGNDLNIIKEDIFAKVCKVGKYIKYEEAFKNNVNKREGRTLSDISILSREYKKNGNYEERYHISILDIDDTGFLNMLSVKRNKPTTKPMLCNSGDVLISCINPKIWRATIVPEMQGIKWSCSSEFAILRSKNKSNSNELYNIVMSEEFRYSAITLAKGTSSSRQRIQKDALMQISIENIQFKDIGELIRNRDIMYKERLNDISLSESFWGGTI